MSNNSLRWKGRQIGPEYEQKAKEEIATQLTPSTEEDEQQDFSDLDYQEWLKSQGKESNVDGDDDDCDNTCNGEPTVFDLTVNALVSADLVVRSGGSVRSRIPAKNIGWGKGTFGRADKIRAPQDPEAAPTRISKRDPSQEYDAYDDDDHFFEEFQPRVRPFFAFV